MANKKFSQFDLKTNSADVQFVVGYNGTDNVRIAPSNLGGGGASDLNGLSDCLVDTESLYVGEVPSSLSGNPQNNTSLGIDASRDLTTATQTTSIGNRAGKQATTGLGNTNLGYQAGSQNQTGIFNTNIGNGAGFWNTASYSVFVGYDSGQVTGGYNTGIGVSALGKAFSSSCIQSVAVGYRAGHQQTAANVVMVGFDAARANTATGHISIGSQAGYSNTSGTSNTNIGYYAGYSNTTGGSQVCIGYEAGKNITGGVNTFIGSGSASGGTGAAFDNTALGQNSLFALTTGNANVAIGRKAGLALTNAADNTLVGYDSGKRIVGGGTNTCVGHSSGYYITSGTGNVTIGRLAGQSIGAGTNNVAIGNSTDGTINGTNTVVIGYSATSSIANASNQVTLGNSSIATLRCAVTSITAISDERDKTDIEALPYGLDFIDSLQPKKFVWDNRAETDADGNEFFSSRKGKKDIGFIAQDLQGVDDDYLNLVYDENPDKLEATYGRLIPVLVQAIKELKAEVELLKS